MGFHYVAMDFGGHGLSSHHHPGFPYQPQNYVNEVRRVAAALKWNRFSLLGHSFGGTIGGMFSCIFPELVDKLILLDSSPFFLESKEIKNLPTYKRQSIEHVLLVEAKDKPPKVLSPEEMLQSFLKNNTQVGEECGKLLLERGTTRVAQGLVLNRDRRLSQPENHFEVLSKDQFEYICKKIQARILVVKADQGYSYFRPIKDDEIRESMDYILQFLKSTLKERFQYMEVVGNHYVHMREPQHVAGVISDFLQSNP
ncbi:serine hydrolase-like protein 2 isoform X2 [Macrotis lagotis]|uniref:serine hydrolase-like protein 2 isoform X2 n=1 Tax=Macrotis lagotis TaxID=92651 RepID=UPI003D696C0A